MKNKKWKQFEKLTDQCYMNMIGTEGCIPSGERTKRVKELLSDG